MKALKTNFAVKVIAFLLALATGVGGFWASLFILSQWDTLWTGTGYYTSNSYYQDLNNRFYQAQELAQLLQQKEWSSGSCPTWTSSDWRSCRASSLRNRPTSGWLSAATTPAPCSTPTGTPTCPLVSRYMQWSGRR